MRRPPPFWRRAPRGPLLLAAVLLWPGPRPALLWAAADAAGAAAGGAAWAGGRPPARRGSRRPAGGLAAGPSAVDGLEDLDGLGEFDDEGDFSDDEGSDLEEEDLAPSGARKPEFTNKEKYALRKLANQWKSKGVMPLVRADETGMDVENFLLDIDEALTTNRLVKVTFTEEDPAAKEAFAGRIAQMLRAHVVLVLGKTALLYRPGESCLSGAPGGLRDRGRRHRADPLGAPPETSAAAASSRDRAVIRCSRIAPGRAERV